MAIQIPVFIDLSADFSQNIDLDNVNITIRIVYNTRTELFFMSVSNGSKSIQGIKLVRNYPLLQQYKARFDVLPGDFIVLKLNDSDEIDLNYDNFGTTWNLYYLTSEEIQQWMVDNGI